MGDRHGGRFARRGRALNPSRPQVDAHREVGFRWRGVVSRICPRRNTPLGESLPTRRTGERICPAQKHSPRRRPPDTAHERKNLPTRERSPRRKPPDTAHEQKNLPRAGTLSSAKASRHGAKAKRFVPRRNTPRGKGLPTRRTSEGICPHENALLGEGLPTRRASEKICPAGFAFAPRADERRDTLGRRTAEKHPFGGVAPTACGRCRVHSPKKIRLLHETQLFYGESHVGSR